MYYDNVSYQVQVTNDCFLACDYCMTAETNMRKQVASTDTVKKLLNASLGFRSVYMVFLGGEPLMAGKGWFEEAFSHINQQEHLLVNSRIYTNGLLLDDEWVDLFKRNKCQIVFSYDGLGNGKKGSKRALEKLTTYSDVITYASMTMSESNYKSLIDCYKQVSEAGVKRFAVQFDIYANSELMTLFGREVCKLFEYIEANPNGAKFSTYNDARFVMTGKGRPLSNEFDLTVINNDYCINADGNITLGVPDCLDPEWQLGNVKDLKHVNDLLFSDVMRQVNRDYIESLNLIGDLAKVNHLTHGGGFFFDKKGIMPMNRPNIPKLHCYREILRYFGEV
ncbi:radical SAM protein [Vibrio diabolicus]|uniref:radical SAM protein n=1 Tax=Vibrio diabolicus TaxID=50719 RepID=UPI00211AE9ED|nr:radical SAM protein [Vibrio diabolicus]MCG6221379.1 radical SAM protein [Vibrio diabolicus]MCG6242616.1 radical SAM protein [Vibrio diabolicus]